MPVIIDDQNGDIIAGGAGSEGSLVLRNDADQQRLSLTAGGLIESGGNGADGEIRLFARHTDLSVANFTDAIFQLKALLGIAMIQAGGQGFNGRLTLRDADGKIRFILDADTAKARIHGDLDILDSGTPTIKLHGSSAEIEAGAQDQAGTLKLLSDKAKEAIHLDGSQANIIAGGEGGDGDLILRSRKGQTLISLNAESANIKAGGHGVAGDLELFSATDEQRLTGQGTIQLDGDTANISAGGRDTEGDLVLRGINNEKRISLGGGGKAFIGGNGSDGVLAVFDKNGDNSNTDRAAIRMDAERGEFRVKNSLRFVDGALHLGGGNLNGRILLRDFAEKETIRVEGDTGDVILLNADCAEDFDLANGEETVPGAVMVLSEDGSLRQSEQEYDTAVAGVVSGAGSYRPGIVLDRRASERPRVPLAMMGKVFCLVDADFGAVRAGTLLTTSPRRGHAMRAADPARAFGSVIGKALKPLERGQALIPVMVALQ